MWQHLRSSHAFTDKSPPIMRQGIEKFAVTMREVPLPKEQARFDDLVVEMIAKDCRPFSIVSDDGFSSLISGITQGQYKLPYRRTVTAMFNERYAQKESEVIYEIK
jgi:hypothetical protein